MVKGKVKWFNNTKGFGFIIPELGSDDVFEHYSQIQIEGYKSLKPDDLVEFEIIDGKNGKQAQNIQLVK